MPPKRKPDLVVELNGGPYHGHVESLPHGTAEIVKTDPYDGSRWVYQINGALGMGHCIGRFDD